jgi:hypothetical protein
MGLFIITYSWIGLKRVPCLEPRLCCAFDDLLSWNATERKALTSDQSRSDEVGLAAAGRHMTIRFQLNQQPKQLLVLNSVSA